jgi:hypothetical protein
MRNQPWAGRVAAVAAFAIVAGAPVVNSHIGGLLGKWPVSETPMLARWPVSETPMLARWPESETPMLAQVGGAM